MSQEERTLFINELRAKRIDEVLPKSTKKLKDSVSITPADLNPEESALIGKLFNLMEIDKCQK